MYDNWHNLSLAQQLGNVGSDYERALRWKSAGHSARLAAALARTLEQMDLTLADSRWSGPKRREIARARDEVCNEILYRDDAQSADRLKRYFLAFAIATQQAMGLD